MKLKHLILAGLVSMLLPVLVFGQTPEEIAKLEKAIQNPIAAMISLPFQDNIDFGLEPGNVVKNTMNVQPVVPVGLGSKVNMIVRTIIPYINMPGQVVGEGDTRIRGLGDIALSLFFTPAKPGKLIWGVGPALGFPTATDPMLGTGFWTAGPSVIALIQPKGWTFGGLVQNTWSYAGWGSGNVNFFYSQVFITKNLPQRWYVNTAPIITANWNAPEGQQWVVPVGMGVGKLFKIGKQAFNGQVGYYYFVEKPDQGPSSPDWQLRIQLNLLFPKVKK